MISFLNNNNNHYNCCNFDVDILWISLVDFFRAIAYGGENHNNENKNNWTVALRQL
jgi:hypothetical protein